MNTPACNYEKYNTMACKYATVCSNKWLNNSLPLYCVTQRATFKLFEATAMSPRISLLKMLLKDRRGAVALETPFVLMFLFFSLLFPLADLAIAGFKFIFAYQAMRDLGQYVQYHTPPDVTNWSSWKSSLPSAINGYSISGVRVICGDTNQDCSSTNTASPKYYNYQTTVTVSPMVLGPVFCGGGKGSCSFTPSYSERFQ